MSSNRVRRPRANPQIKYGPKYGQRFTSDTMLTSQMYSLWCDGHRIGSALLTS